MRTVDRHPVDSWTDEQLKELLFRVDTRGFPADLGDVWQAERVRFRETLRRIPPATNAFARILDIGSSRAWLPFYQVLLGYQRITLTTAYPASGFISDDLTVQGALPADVGIEAFDAERDPFPFDDECFDVVACLEVLEHLAIDPMAMMIEVNRVLKPGGVFVLTTPNAVRTSNVVSAILGEHPLGWSHYNGFDTNRHNREYTPAEIDKLFRAAGITPMDITTFGEKPRGTKRDRLARMTAAILSWVSPCPGQWRRDVIIATGRKTGAPLKRRPTWLYFDMAERRVALNKSKSFNECASVDGDQSDHHDCAVARIVSKQRL